MAVHSRVCVVVALFKKYASDVNLLHGEPPDKDNDAKMHGHNFVKVSLKKSF